MPAPPEVRALLGDAVVNAALAPLRAKLASLAAGTTEESLEQRLKQVTILFVDIRRSTMSMRNTPRPDLPAVAACWYTRQLRSECRGSAGREACA